LGVRADAVQIPHVIELMEGWIAARSASHFIAFTGHFVTTSNRHFPLDPHTLIPFYQFFPVAIQRRVAPYSPGYLRR
jgi:hypothetical protein